MDNVLNVRNGAETENRVPTTDQDGAEEWICAPGDACEPILLEQWWERTVELTFWGVSAGTHVCVHQVTVKRLRGKKAPPPGLK